MKAVNHIITIMGATGTVGREVLEFFSQSGINCRAITRDLRKAQIKPFVNWVQGNLEDENELPRLLENSKSLFLVSGVSDKTAELQCNVINAARQAGVGHIVKLSSPGATKDAKFKAGQQHWEIEQALKNSGLSWNILQPQSFMQNWLGELAASVKKERKIYEAAGEGKKPFIDARDIGEVAFTLLTQPAEHINKTFMLSGPAAISYHEVAAAISKAINEEVVYVSLSPEAAKKRYEERGFPEWATQMFLAISMGQRSGAAEGSVTTAVKEILGKQPRTVSDFARDYANHFK